MWAERMAMAIDPNPTLRAELTAALDVVTPQLRGLTAFGWMQSLSPAAHDAVNNQILERSRRRYLIKDVLHALDDVRDALAALAADGYPELPSSRKVLAALRAEIDAFEIVSELK